MAMSRLPSDNLCKEIHQLQVVFGDISLDECQLLVEEFGGGDITEVTSNVCEALESSRCSTVVELLWHLKQNPAYANRRGISMEPGNPRRTEDTWMLARSRSSTSSRPSSHPSTPTHRLLGDNNGALHSMPYSGTKNPIQIRRTSRSIEQATVRQYLSKYLQDTEMRNILQDIYEDQSKKLVIILRGASGSGKSTLASIIWSITESGEICSADNYFANRAGVYKFNRSLLPQAHESCRSHCKTALKRGDMPIIIDNTNTRADEMLPYVEMAVDYGYDVMLLEPKTEWKKKAGILAAKNVHGVPKKNIEDQLDRFEKLTARVLIDRVMKSRQGAAKSNVKPYQDMDWGSSTQPIDTWMPPPTTRAPPGFAPFSPATSLTSLTMPTSQGKPKLTSLPRTSPLPWSEPLSTPPSPLLLSDLVPDLKTTSNGPPPKPKRGARRNANSNVTQASKTIPGTAQRVVFDDPAHKAFSKLCKLFPTVSRNKLEELFNTYEGDVDNCASALLEDGVEMTGTIDSEDSPSSEAEAVEGAVGYDYGYSPWESNKNININNQPFDVENLKTSSSTDDDVETASTALHSEDSSDPGVLLEEDNECFELTLPMEFARLLVCAYGHPHDEGRSIAQEELKVKVPADAAFEIYKSLYLNMHRADSERNSLAESERAEGGSTRSSSPSASSVGCAEDEEFTEMAINLAAMELETTSDDPQLSTIMDLESKIDQQNTEALKCYSAKNRTMAQNIQYSMLKQEYPFLDAAVIDEVYTQCCLKVDKTRDSLNEMYPQSIAQLQASQNAQVTSSWHLKYNPKDVQLYSLDELKALQKKYDELEREWMNKMNKMRENYEKVKNMSSPQIKAHYVTEANKISEEMKDLADEMQYYKCVSMNARHKNDQILDLHGLKINGAMRVLKEFLQYKEEEFSKAGIPKMILLIITGQGKHSKNGCPVLQPAVRNFLTQRKYKYHCGTGNPGTFNVILTRSILNRKM